MRKEIFITTKVHKVKSVYEDVKRCIKELDVDYLDLVLLHRPDCISSYKFLIQLRNEGYIRFIGVSNFNIDQLKKLEETPYINQVEISLFNQNEELINYCHENKIIIQSHSCFAKDFKEKFSLINDFNYYNLVLNWLFSKNIHVVIGTSSVEHMIENLYSNYTGYCDNLKHLDIGYRKFNRFK